MLASLNSVSAASDFEGRSRRGWNRLGDGFHRTGDSYKPKRFCGLTRLILIFPDVVTDADQCLVCFLFWHCLY